MQDRLKKSLSLYVVDKIGEEKIGESEEDLSGTLKNGNKGMEVIQECLTAELDRKGKAAKKRRMNKLNKARRRSIGSVEKLEDIQSVVNKKLIPCFEKLMEETQVGTTHSTQTNLDDKKDEVRTKGKRYLAMNIKGYESDSALYEKHRVAIHT